MSTFKESEVKLISVIIPTVNGNEAKLLAVSTEQYAEILGATHLNSLINEKLDPVRIYSLFADADLNHTIIQGGNTGGFDKAQFDKILKDTYNAKQQLDTKGQPLLASE